MVDHPVGNAFSVAVIVVGITAFIFALVYAIFGTMLVYQDLFPAHGRTVCLLSHDEEHDGATFTLCDRRVPR